MAAIAWLERAFGFARGLVVAGDDGTVCGIAAIRRLARLRRQP